MRELRPVATAKPDCTGALQRKARSLAPSVQIAARAGKFFYSPDCVAERLGIHERIDSSLNSIPIPNAHSQRLKQITYNHFKFFHKAFAAKRRELSSGTGGPARRQYTQHSDVY
jgi:hypothetical protein